MHVHVFGAGALSLLKRELHDNATLILFDDAGLFLSRAAVGLGEGVAPSSATDMVARVISQDERSRAMSFIFGGLHVGSLLGLFVAPPLIERFGWPTVFYAFGLLG